MSTIPNVIELPEEINRVLADAGDAAVYFGVSCADDPPAPDPVLRDKMNEAGHALRWEIAKAIALTDEERDVLDWCRARAEDTIDLTRGDDGRRQEAQEVVEVLARMLARPVLPR